MTKQGERKVKDLMISIEEYGAVPFDGSIRDAFEVLRRSGHRAVMVLDKNNEPVGRVDVRDILIALEPKYATRTWGDSWFTLETFKNYPVFYYEGKFSGQCKTQSKKEIREIMSPIEFTIDEDATLAEAVHMITTHNLWRLPVRRGDKLVGMIRLMDIIDEVEKVILQQ